MHSHGSSCWRGNVKRARSSCAVVVGVDDEVGAVRRDREVAPDDLGHEQLVGDRLVELLAEHGADAVLERRVVLALPRAGTPTGCGTAP